MEKFKEGTVCYHLATSKRCVVIQINVEKNLVKVRTSDDEERDYYPHELKTQQEIDNENRDTITQLSQNDLDLYY